MTDPRARIAQLEAAMKTIWQIAAQVTSSSNSVCCADCGLIEIEAHRALAASAPAPDCHQVDLVTAGAVQEAARVLLGDPDAVMRLARAYDCEDSAQRGEADPHGPLFADEPHMAEWQDERRHCAIAALRALAGEV